MQRRLFIQTSKFEIQNKSNIDKMVFQIIIFQLNTDLTQTRYDQKQKENGKEKAIQQKPSVYTIQVNGNY